MRTDSRGGYDTFLAGGAGKHKLTKHSRFNPNRDFLGDALHAALASRITSLRATYVTPSRALLWQLHAQKKTVWDPLREKPFRNWTNKPKMLVLIKRIVGILSFTWKLVHHSFHVQPLSNKGGIVWYSWELMRAFTGIPVMYTCGKTCMCV